MRWLVLVALGGCLQSNAVVCDDGTICPSDRTCDLTNHQCVSQDQRAVCAGMLDGTSCTADNVALGECSAEVCIAAICGDGRITNTERCDGDNLGNRRSCKDLGYYNDAPLTCTDDCRYDDSACSEYCGDGILNGLEFCEAGVAQDPVSCLEYGYDRGLVGCTATCQPDFSVCETFGFGLVSTGTGASMRGLWASAPDDLFVVGDAVVHWDGATWTTQDAAPGMALGPDRGFYAVWGSGPNDVWAVGADLSAAAGDQGLVSHYANGSWTATRIHSPPLTAVWGTGPTNVYAVGASGAIVHYDGTTWTAMTSGTADALNAVWGSGPSDIYATGDSGLFHFDGSTWTQVGSTGTFRGVHGLGATDVWAASTASSVGPVEVLHKTGAGFVSVASFANQSMPRSIYAVSADRVFVPMTPQPGYVLSIGMIDAGEPVRFSQIVEMTQLWAASASDVWGVSSTGALRRFRGTAWLGGTSPGFGPLHVTGASDSTFYVTGPGTAPTKFSEWNGSTWTARANLPAQPLQISAAAKDDVYATTPNGDLLRFDGTSWTAALPELNYFAVWARSSTDVWAAGYDGSNGVVIHFDGTSWSAPILGPDTIFTTVWAASATNVFAIAGLSSPTMWHYDGSTWTQMTIPPNTDVDRIWGTSGSDVYASGNGGVIHYDGTTWTSLGLKPRIWPYRVAGTAANDVFIVGDAGTMYHYDGVQWVPMRAPTTLTLFDVVVSPHRVAVASRAGALILVKP